MRRHLAIWMVALVVPGGVLILAAYYLRTKPWFKEDRNA
jgi:hypothetical protein